MKLKGLKNYKIADQDYEVSMLPQTRRAVFFDVLKLQWRKLILLGGILVLFALPMIVLNLVRDYSMLALYQFYENTSDEIQYQAAMQSIWWDFIKSVIQIIPFMIYSLGLAGVMRVLRQFAWGENVYIPTDFGKGFKDNLRPMLGISFLAGAILALCNFLYYLAVSYQTDEMWMLCIIPIAFSALFVLPIFAISIVMVPVYNNSLMQIFKMAFLIYLKGFGKVLLGVVLTIALRVLAMIPNSFFHFVFGIFASLAAPTVLLGWTLFCYNRFDKDLNPTLCPDLINRGVYVPSEEGSEEI